MKKWRALILGNGEDQGRKNVIWNMIGSLLFALASIVLFAAAARAAVGNRSGAASAGEVRASYGCSLHVFNPKTD